MRTVIVAISFAICRGARMSNFLYTHALLLILLVLLIACASTPSAPTPSTAPTNAPPPTLSAEATNAPPPATTAPPANPTTAPAATNTVANPTTAPVAVGKVRTTPSHSSPIAVTSDDSKIVVVNPLNGTVTILNVAGDANQKIAEVQVGVEPQTVAISNDDKFAYVTNQGSNTVSKIDLTTNTKVADIPVGVEPYGIALTPDGIRAYVVNGGSGSVWAFDTVTDKVIFEKKLPIVEPRAIAITANNNGVGPQFVYVTQFLSQLAPNGKEMTDTGREAKVIVLTTTDDENIAGTIILSPHETGFTADRSAFGGGKEDMTSAFPNQLQSIVLKNGKAYLPNIAASPQAPVRFDVDTQAFVSVFDAASKAELPGGTINLHLAVKNQTATPRLFLANPWAIDFKHNANEGYVVSAGSNVIAKIQLNEQGIPSVVTVPVTETNRVLTIPVGKNPRGIVVNHADTRAYVMNFISRDVSVIDLSASPEKEIAKIQSANLPAAGSEAFVTLTGNELFNASVGEFDEGVKGRMSNNGWQACSSCHFEGLTDGVIWQFPSGPRKSVPLNSTFSPTNSDTDQRVLNYSGIFDEVCDFETNIRNVSGGAGLIITDTVGANPPTAPHPVLTAFNPPNCGRTQLHVGGIGAWDALTLWVAKKVRSPQSPYTNVEANSERANAIAKGRQLFTAANCQLCHGGPKWSTSQVDFARTSPPSEPNSLEEKPVAQVPFLARFLRIVGTFDASNPIEKNLANLTALGSKGFNPPSLLSIYAFPPYFHNGACPTLDCVIDDAYKAHRDAGGKTGVLDNPEDRAALIEFLNSIDATSEPINP
jgi:YVTN family beta-propeller protein